MNLNTNQIKTKENELTSKQRDNIFEQLDKGLIKIEHCNDIVKKDKDICLYVIKNDIHSLKHFSNELQTDEDVLKILKECNYKLGIEPKEYKRIMNLKEFLIKTT
jgi:hypothetical protein